MTATAAQPKGRPWWLTLIMGIAAVVVGGVLIFGSLTAQARMYLLLVMKASQPLGRKICRARA